jgi:hypothetical protein
VLLCSDIKRSICRKVGIWQIENAIYVRAEKSGPEAAVFVIILL